MIFHQNQRNLGQSAWVSNPIRQPIVPLTFDFPFGGLLRVEGRNNATDAPTLLAFISESKTLACPWFAEYRVTVVNLAAGGFVRSARIEGSLESATVQMAYPLQNRQRNTPKGIRKGGFKHSLIFPFDFLHATPGTIGADRGAIIAPATAVKDFTNCRSGEVQSGETAQYSIKVTSPSGSSGEFRYDYRASQGGPGPIDITGGTGLWPTVLMKVWLDPAIQQPQSGPMFKLVLGFQDSSARIQNLTLANFQQFASSAVTGPGWNILLAQPTVATMNSVDPTAVEMFRFYVQPNAGVVTSLTLDSCHFLVNDASKKLIAFRDDDGYADCWKTAAEFDKWGIRGNFHIHPMLVGTPGYVSLANLREMQRNGHMIGNHGWSKFDGDQLSGNFYTQRNWNADEYWRNNIYPAMMWLQDNGFEQGSRIYATHQGNMLPDQREALFERGIDIISNTATSAEQAAFTNHPDFLEWQHATGYVAPSAQATLDILDAQGGLAVFYGHADTSVVTAQMASVMARVVPKIKDGTYKCVTMAEMVAGL